MSAVAVFGSRRGVNVSKVQEFMRTLHATEPEDVIVSGGADGVDKAAESEWLNLGGIVVSFRPQKIDDLNDYPQWAITRWDLGSEYPAQRIMHDQPTWGNFDSAAFYRDLLIAETADKGVAFWDGHSRGTAATIDAFKVLNKPVYVFKEQK